jgi:hypothetical protein
MKTKYCPKCNQDKLIEEFCKDINRKGGLQPYCKSCNKKYRELNKEQSKLYSKEYNKKYYPKNRVKLLKQQKLYRNSHKKEIKEYFLAYYSDNSNKLKHKIVQKKWNMKNKLQISERMKKYNELHKNENSIKAKLYYQKNKEKRLLYERNKLKTDIYYKLVNHLRRRIYSAIKHNSKSQSTIQLLGCSVIQLKQHLESQFKPGMTWDNYGYYGWHVDHILPCASFDLSKPEEQRKCFNYTNLQPLWMKENLEKSDKMLEEK